jgi:hypothetical protein
MNIFERTLRYFQLRKPRKPVDSFESIKSLIEFPINQSQSIRLGKVIEDILRLEINETSDWEDIKPANQTGEKERDHLFRRDGVTTYAELKSNLNLDSEKKKATREKAKHIAAEEHTEGIIVALRHYSQETLSRSSCTTFYEKSELKVLPVNEYMEIYGIKCPFGSEREYVRWLNLIATELVKEDTDAEHLEAAETLMNLKT